MTVIFYFKNNLGLAAGSCTFGFIFSFIPIIMLILTSCIGLMSAYPRILTWISSSLSLVIGDVFDISSYIERLSSGFSVSGVNIVLTFFIIWMARKLFASIIQAMRSIFNTVAPARLVLNQLLTFAGELVVIVICAVVLFAAFISSQILTLPVFMRFKEVFPLIFSSLSNNVVSIAFYFILFLFTLVCYRVASGTKPPVKLCIATSVMCVGFFYMVVWFVSRTINKANYSTIYGILSNLMILLFEVWFFFSIFVFFAQLIYVWQYLDFLMVGEIYLLPNRTNMTKLEAIHRLLFINPYALMENENLVHYKKGEKIYSEGDAVECAFYVFQGSVVEKQKEFTVNRFKGDSFGETELIMKTKRISETVAQTDCTLIRIPEKDFEILIGRNTRAAKKAIEAISSAYGKTSL